MRSGQKYVLVGVIGFAALVALWQFTRAGASETKSAGRRPQVVPVRMATVGVKSVPIEIRAIGRVEPSSTVDIHAQVGGQVTRVAFAEGDFVKRGDALFGIDPRTSQSDATGARADYERAIAIQKQAEANLAKDRAIAQTAAVEAKRYETLAESGVVSRSQYDQIRTNADAAAATIRADEDAVNTQRKAVAAAKADLDASRVRLGFTTITAPVAGKTGALQVHQGDVVAPGDQTPLVVINQIEPINVTFSVPESDFVRLQNTAAKDTLAVLAAPAAEPGAISKGRLSFVDNTVDPSTGTIKLKASFGNADRRLWPGQFVNVTVTLGVEKNAVVVPKDAVQTGQQGQYVFVVRPDDTAEVRPVEVARVVEGDAIVASGLQEGERVVTDGQLRLTPGAPVRDASVQNAGGEKS